jgi:hypothetical protein
MSLRLSTRIREEGLADAVAQTFRAELVKLAQLSGPMQDTEAALIKRLVWTEKFDIVSCAPFDALWQCSALFLEACVTVAVTEDGYTVEKARHISQLAHRLGFSARQLSQLEHDVIGALADKARTLSATGSL